MTTIESSRLLLMRVQKAVGLINHLRNENKELQARFSLVENHNRELQELIDRVSTDQAVIDEAINSALSELESTIGDFEDFGTLDMDELSAAEDFGLPALGCLSKRAATSLSEIAQLLPIFCAGSAPLAMSLRTRAGEMPSSAALCETESMEAP